MKTLKGMLILGFTAFACVWASAQIASILEANGSLSWKFNSGQYTITGAISMSGSVDPGDPLVFSFQDLNNDGIVLDVRLRVQDLVPDLGIDYEVDLIATVISDSATEAIIRWFASDDPNQCATVNIGGTEVQAKVTHLEGALQARVTPIDCQLDPFGVLNRNVNLRLDENGGDANNYLLAQGYLFCIEQQSFWTEARIFNMDWDGYGGGSANGDVDANGCVDDADLLAVLFAFGGTDAGCADVNSDGIVDDADLLTVLFNFGSGC